MRRLIVVLICLLVCVSLSNAQSPEIPTYTVKDGNLYADVGDGSQMIPFYRYQAHDGKRKFVAAAPDSYDVDLYVSDFDASVVLVRVFWDDDTDALYAVSYDDGSDDALSFSDITPSASPYDFHEIRWADLPPRRDVPILFDEQHNFALLSLGGADPRFPQTREDFTYVKVYSYAESLSPYRTGETSYTVGQLPWGLAIDLQADDAATIPTLVDFTYTPQNFTATVEAITGETLRLTQQQIEQVTSDDTTAPVEFVDAPRIANCDSATTDCTPGGVLARIGETAVITPLQGDTLDSFRRPRDANGRYIFTTREYASGTPRRDRMYLVDSAPLRVRCLLGCTERFNGRLNGGVVFPPNNRDMIYFIAYTERDGSGWASIWQLRVDQPTPTPEVVDDGLRFWADAGNFSMPRFIDTFQDGFVVRTTGVYNGSDVRVYNWSGELYGTVELPAPEFP